jgi:hypothetical protein
MRFSVVFFLFICLLRCGNFQYGPRSVETSHVLVANDWWNVHVVDLIWSESVSSTESALYAFIKAGTGVSPPVIIIIVAVIDSD